MKRRVAVAGDRLSTGGHVLNDSHVCRPDTSTHTIAIRAWSSFTDLRTSAGETQLRLHISERWP